MATHLEIYDFMANATLRNKVTAACLIMANTIRLESDATPNHDNRLIWAKLVYDYPEQAGERMLRAVLSQNSAASVAQIEGATDATISTAVAAAVDVFAVGASV